jgi:SAM-dependent methyltransferase
VDTLDDPYARIARWYDAEHDAFDDDVQFYRDLAAGAGREVLEIGCGTGRVAVELARSGRSVTGVDRSAAMLARCRERLAAEPEMVRQRVRLVHGDAIALPDEVDGSFSLALIALNTFAHFLTPGERLAVLIQLRQRLVPGGRLVLDLDLHGPRRLLESPGHLWLLGVWNVPGAGVEGTDAAATAETAEGAPVQVAHFASAVPARGADAAIVTHFYDEQAADGVVRRTTSRMALALLSQGEAEMTLRQAGYAVETVYGSYELDAYEPGAERAIIVAHTELTA